MTQVPPADRADRLWSDLIAFRPPWSEPLGSDVPAICLNMVVSVDGATTVGGRVGPLTGQADQAVLRRLRAEADAVLVGAQTVRVEGYGDLLDRDDRLRRAREGRAPEPLLCIVSTGMALEESSPALGPASSALVFLTCSRDALPRAARPVAAIRCAEDPPASRGLELRPLLRRLREQFGVEGIVCEGGPTLNAALLAEDLVQEMFVSISPRIAGQAAAPGLAGDSDRTVPLELVGHATDGDFAFLRYRRRR